eukprot:scaffold120716_cov27-Tisochrysis_lutea.AAC.1
MICAGEHKEEGLVSPCDYGHASSCDDGQDNPMAPCAGITCALFTATTTHPGQLTCPLGLLHTRTLIQRLSRHY